MRCRAFYRGFGWAEWGECLIYTRRLIIAAAQLLDANSFIGAAVQVAFDNFIRGREIGDFATRLTRLRDWSADFSMRLKFSSRRASIID